ncbi:aldehyde dehydrogenase family protein [Nocardioides sp. TRM66260-LWL]|uniref:aldehyde dehydrogenase family protein n=1 Tax=Nocardioides sp. TRM66260-LWL TaxID=2874478 RepID=UPI001CC3A499|nr:aldehyde dehydrogenase family protein [Nocardioides sp. TRM66260-LWL]MBZ5732987.1 aldehyde dehydrogenase family protein [Nocardioides sp. TRM66260-LWL]
MSIDVPPAADTADSAADSAADVLAAAPAAGPDALRATHERLRATFRTGRTRSYEWRHQQLTALGRLVEENEERIAQALHADLGRTPAEAWLGDLSSTTAEIEFARKRLRRWMRRRRTGLPLNQRPASAWIQYDPLGTVLVIGPWNYPVYLVLSPLVAAIAAGNCAVLKPSELAPACSALMAELIPAYLDSSAIAVVEGDGETTQQLLALGFDHALFTGGTEVGRHILAGAAATLTPVTLELGGKSPVIVHRDADLEVAARRIAWLKLMNSGQTCIAPDYVLVDRAVADRFVGLLTATLAEFTADRGAGLRVVNERQHARLVGCLERTRGEIVLGGTSDAEALTIAPTVVLDPAPDDAVMADELFGPILPVLRYTAIDDAIDLIEQRPAPLALYCFTGDAAVREQVGRVAAGGIVFNHVAMHVLAPQLPFGGVGESGMGAYHGEWGFQTLSHRKPVLVKTTWPDPRFVYPPYTDAALRLMRRLF